MAAALEALSLPSRGGACHARHGACLASPAGGTRLARAPFRCKEVTLHRSTAWSWPSAGRRLCSTAGELVQGPRRLGDGDAHQEAEEGSTVARTRISPARAWSPRAAPELLATTSLVTARVTGSSSAPWLGTTRLGWTAAVKSTAADAIDCRAWSNDQRVLCFGCDACKTSVVTTAIHHWKAVAVVNVAVLVLLSLSYSLGCCAIRNNRDRRYYYLSSIIAFG
nr:unnamed protein product [Digitaria exilis]